MINRCKKVYNDWCSTTDLSFNVGLYAAHVLPEVVIGSPLKHIHHSIITHYLNHIFIVALFNELLGVLMLE